MLVSAEEARHVEGGVVGGAVISSLSLVTLSLIKVMEGFPAASKQDE